MQINSPVPYEIRYCVNNFGEKTDFTMVYCPYNEHNFKIISRLYEDAFQTKLEDEPSPDYLRKYFLERIRLGF